MLLLPSRLSPAGELRKAMAQALKNAAASQ
jgi:hypothetical protein